MDLRRPAFTGICIYLYFYFVRRETVTLLCCDLRNMSIHQSLEFDACVFPPFRLIAGILRFAAASALLVTPILTAKSNPQFPGLPYAHRTDTLVVTESVYAGYPSLVIPG